MEVGALAWICTRYQHEAGNCTSSRVWQHWTFLVLGMVTLNEGILVVFPRLTKAKTHNMHIFANKTNIIQTTMVKNYEFNTWNETSSCTMPKVFFPLLDKLNLYVQHTTPDSGKLHFYWDEELSNYPQWEFALVLLSTKWNTSTALQESFTVRD